ASKRRKSIHQVTFPCSRHTVYTGGRNYLLQQIVKHDCAWGLSKFLSAGPTPILTRFTLYSPMNRIIYRYIFRSVVMNPDDVTELFIRIMKNPNAHTSFATNRVHSPIFFILHRSIG